MKVNLGTLDLNAEYRQYLRLTYGQTGLATRKEIKQWVWALIEGELDTLAAVHQETPR